jgi:hypothetical protein
MKSNYKGRLLAGIASALGLAAPFEPRSLGRAYTRDAQAYQFRMPAGFQGDVNRTHPASIEPVTMDPTNPPTFFGQAGIIDATSHYFRTVLAGDTGITDIYGITVRPYPFQQQTSTGTGFGQATIGSATPSTVNKLDVLRSGYIMVNLANFAAQPSVKGGSVYVWVAASTGTHVQGGFEASNTGGSTIELPATTTFNGAPDSSGNVELYFHQA